MAVAAVSPTMEGLPDEIIVEIFHQLPIKDRVKLLTVNRRWRRLMPFADQNGFLEVTTLPFNLDFVIDCKVKRSAITSALKAILPRDGSTLKTIAFGTDWRQWEAAKEHFHLVAEFCPQLVGLKLEKMWISGPTDISFTSLRRLGHVRSFSFNERRHVKANWSEDDSAGFIADLSSLIALWDLQYLNFTQVVCDPVTFDCYGNPTGGFTDAQLAGLCRNSSNLTELSLQNSRKLTDCTPIGQLPLLTKLELTECLMDESAMDLIAQGCPQLNWITLACRRLPGLKWLRHLMGLKFFSFRGNFSGADVVDIPHIWAVEELQIDTEANLMTDAELLELSGKTPLLRRLVLSGITPVLRRLVPPAILNDDGVVLLADRWDQLEELQLVRAEISDLSVAKLGVRRNLRRLALVNCNRIMSTHGFWHLAAKRRRLGLSTPLELRLDCEMFRRFCTHSSQTDNIKEELETVGVTLLP